MASSTIVSPRFPKVSGLTRATRDHTSVGLGLWNRGCTQSTFSSCYGTRITAYGEWRRRGIEDGIHVVHLGKWVEENLGSRVGRSCCNSFGCAAFQTVAQLRLCLAGRKYNPTRATLLSRGLFFSSNKKAKEGSLVLVQQPKDPSSPCSMAFTCGCHPQDDTSRWSCMDKHSSWVASRTKAQKCEDYKSPANRLHPFLIRKRISWKLCSTDFHLAKTRSHDHPNGKRDIGEYFLPRTNQGSLSKGEELGHWISHLQHLHRPLCNTYS